MLTKEDMQQLCADAGLTLVRIISVVASSHRPPWPATGKS
jgi:hypothetical protein